MVDEFLKDSWSFFRNHWLSLALIVLPISVALEVVSTLGSYLLLGHESKFPEMFLALTIFLVGYPIYTGATVLYMASAIAGKAILPTVALKQSVGFWVPYVLFLCLYLVAVMLGTMALVIPALIVSARFAFADFDLVLNRRGPVQSIKNSWQATQGYAWQIFFGYCVITLVIYLPLVLFDLLAPGTGIYHSILEFLLGMVLSLLSLLYPIYAFRVYVFARAQASQQPADGGE